MNDKKRQKRKFLFSTVVAVSVVGVLGFGGAAFGASQAPKFLSAEEVPAAFDEAVQNFPRSLPESAKWPDEAPSSLTTSSEVTAKGEPLEVFSEEGLPAITAAFIWQCAWQSEYFAAVDAEDEDRASEALDELEAFMSIPIVQTNYIDPDEYWLKQVVEPARAGDDAQLRQEFMSCG
jgi:hypothetical protein